MRAAATGRASGCDDGVYALLVQASIQPGYEPGAARNQLGGRHRSRGFDQEVDIAAAAPVIGA
ncbi:MAG: hypothetical protein ACOY42_02975 [Pseudomonadota bacterium]